MLGALLAASARRGIPSAAALCSVASSSGFYILGGASHSFLGPVSAAINQDALTWHGHVRHKHDSSLKKVTGSLSSAASTSVEAPSGTDTATKKGPVPAVKTHGSRSTGSGHVRRKPASQLVEKAQQTEAQKSTRQWLSLLGFAPHESERASIQVDTWFLGTPIDVKAVYNDISSRHPGAYCHYSKREQAAVLVMPHGDEAAGFSNNEFKLMGETGTSSVMVVDGFGALTIFSRLDAGAELGSDDGDSGSYAGRSKKLAAQLIGRLKTPHWFWPQSRNVGPVPAGSPPTLLLKPPPSGFLHTTDSALPARPADLSSLPHEGLKIIVKKLPNLCYVQKVGDDYAVPQLDEKMLIIMAKVLGQSAALQDYDRAADTSLDKLSSIYERLGDNSWYLQPVIGRIMRKISTRDLVMLVVNTNRQYIEMIRKPRLLDDPRFAWHQDRHYNFYKALKDEFDIAHRLTMLATKLESVTDGAKFLVEMRGSRMTLVSEVVIIWLIFYEVLLNPNSTPHKIFSHIFGAFW